MFQLERTKLSTEVETLEEALFICTTVTMPITSLYELLYLVQTGGSGLLVA